MSENTTIEPGKLFRRGLGLKKEVAGTLDREYSSHIIDFFRQNDYKVKVGRFVIHLAKEFGFCYGVDRAIDYAYQTREHFPDKRIFLTGELIHNPHVNRKMQEMGIEFLTGTYARENAMDQLNPQDVVILPAFGVSIQHMEHFRTVGCTLVDTTCGSVLSVWKRVHSYAKDGFTSLIHGKWNHEETIATSSQALKFPNAHYLVVLDMAEAEKVCDYIRGDMDRESFMKKFANAMSPGFDPDEHLLHIGCANQTTMLSGESLAIANRVKDEMSKKYGEENLADHFRSFDTICSATQDRQNAINELLNQHTMDVMIIIGGYNSSNTTHLVEISGEQTSAFHIDDASCLESLQQIRHQPVHQKDEIHTQNWLPNGDLVIGITAGASTPNNKIGEAVMRVLQIRGIRLDPEPDLPAASTADASTD